MKRAIATLLMLCVVLMMPVYAEAQTAYVDGLNADRVHLREGTGTDTASLGLYFTGAPLEIIGEAQGEWMPVQIGAQQGYILGRYLARDGVPDAQTKTARVDNPNTDRVNVRNRPSMRSDVIGQCENGETVTLLGETASGWSYVIAGGQTGYMDSGLLSASAQDTQQALPVQPSGTTEIVGMTADWDYIHRYTAENGAEIYFASVERSPRIKQEDVNMDGELDLVVMVNAGASNAMYEFFLRDGENYRYVKHGGISYGLANYALKDGYVVSDANNGHAGALFEICIFRWAGDELKLVRRAVSDLVRERAYGVNWHTETTIQDRLLMTIRDYQAGEYEGTVIWEKEIADQDVEAALFDEIDRALWQGLK